MNMVIASYIKERDRVDVLVCVGARHGRLGGSQPPSAPRPLSSAPFEVQNVVWHCGIVACVRPVMVMSCNLRVGSRDRLAGGMEEGRRLLCQCVCLSAYSMR